MSKSVITPSNIATLEEFAQRVSEVMDTLNQPEELAKDHLANERTTVVPVKDGQLTNSYVGDGWLDPVLMGLKEYLRAAKAVYEASDSVDQKYDKDGNLVEWSYPEIPVPAQVAGAPDATLAVHFKSNGDYITWDGFRSRNEWDGFFYFTLKVDGVPVLVAVRLQSKERLSITDSSEDSSLKVANFFELWRTYFPVDLNDLEAIRKL